MRIFLLCAVISFLPACAENFVKKAKHVKSSAVGLNRKVTMVSCHDGSKIRGWEGKFMIEAKDGVASWIGDDNKEVKISGCYIIEET